MPCQASRHEIYARLHIGSKIGNHGKRSRHQHRSRAETVGSARGGSDIDLFSYGKSIVNLDAKVAHRALDLGVSKQELYGP